MFFSRDQNGVAIILSPTFSKYYKSSGLPPTVISKNNDLSTGRFIGLKLNIEVKVKGKNKGAFSKKKVKAKIIKLFISSVYQPVDDRDQIEFNTFFLQYICSVPQNCSFRFRSRYEYEYWVSLRKKVNLIV